MLANHLCYKKINSASHVPKKIWNQIAPLVKQLLVLQWTQREQ